MTDVEYESKEELQPTGNRFLRLSEVISQAWEIPSQLHAVLPQHLTLIALNRTKDGESAEISPEDQRGAARLLLQMFAQNVNLGANGGGGNRTSPTVNTQVNVGVQAGPGGSSQAGSEQLGEVPRIAGTQREVAEFFGVSVETIKDWRARGMPGEPGPSGQSGRYDLAEILRWRDATIGPSGRNESGDVGRQEADRRRALAAAEKLELEVRQMRGELIDVATAVREFAHANTHARALLEQGPHRLLGLLPAGATGEDKRRFLREAEKWIAGVVQALHDGVLGRAAQTGDSEQEG